MIFANLAARTENKYAMPITESFEYDYLNRLETITLNGTESSMGYDEYGRIRSKQAQGHDVFSDAIYDDWKKPHAIREATVETNPFDGRSQVIQYTMFDKVASIRVQDGQTLSYHYGYDHQRIKLTEIDREGPTLTCEKTYVGNCEFWNTCLYGAKSLTYLSGPMGVFAVVEKNAGGESLHYIYKDHLGSWTTITDGVGDIEQEASFDAWGNIRSASDWTSPTSEKLLFDRGYTSHEHLYFYGRYYHPNAPHTDLSLINMNGRMYDPIMSSFLSVDNYVQSPENSQNFNRYAYCLNNPLKYTDPSGWFYQGGSHSVASDENARRLVVNSELYAEQYERFFGQKENHKAYYMEGEEQKGVGGAGGGSESPDDDWVYDKRTGKYDWNDYANDEETTPDGYEYVGPSKDDVNAHYIEENGLLLYYLFGPEFGDISTWPGEISAPDGLVDFEMNLDATPTNGWEVVVLAAMNVLYSTINSPYSLFTGKTIGGRVLNTSERESAFADVASNCISMTKPVGQTIKITQTGRQGLKQFIKASEKAGVKFENKNEARIALKINNTLRKNQSCIKSHDRMMNSINYSNAIRKELQK